MFLAIFPSSRKRAVQCKTQSPHILKLALKVKASDLVIDHIYRQAWEYGFFKSAVHL